ncbi:MAG: putative Ig domain-containing protein [Elusimicrobia bacterium]|nr:putative Ig domain-containing protein [Elusimicrobiota bacterium]
MQRNHPSQITSPAVTTAQEGQLYTYQVTATDPDTGDVLSYSLITAPNGLSIDAASGWINWTPSYEQAGNANVSITVTDKGGLSARQTFTLIVENVNRLSLANIQSSQTSVKVGVSVTLDGRDPDADILTYHWSFFSKPQGSNVIVSTTNISQISFVPDQSGDYEAQLIITDPSNAASQPATITIQAIPAEEPPVVTPQSGFIHGKVYDSNTNYTDPFGLRHGGVRGGIAGGSCSGSSGNFNMPWNFLAASLSRAGSTYYSQWAGTIKQYAPGWTRGATNATNMQSWFQSIGLLTGGLGYVNLIAQVQSGQISQNQAYTAVAIHTLMLGSKAAAVTVSAGFEGLAGPAGGIAGAVVIGGYLSGEIDSFEIYLYGQIGVQ